MAKLRRTGFREINSDDISILINDTRGRMENAIGRPLRFVMNGRREELDVTAQLIVLRLSQRLRYGA